MHKFNTQCTATPTQESLFLTHNPPAKRFCYNENSRNMRLYNVVGNIKMMILRRRITNISVSRPDDFTKIYMDELKERINDSISPSNLMTNDSGLRFKTNLANYLTFDFGKSFFNFTIDSASIQIKKIGNSLDIIYEVRFLRNLILCLFPAIIGSIAFTMINGLGISDFILIFTMVYGGFILMTLIFALISLIYLHDILIGEIDPVERKLQRMEI